jgi:hypothetical protein
LRCDCESTNQLQDVIDYFEIGLICLFVLLQLINEVNIGIDLPYSTSEIAFLTSTNLSILSSMSTIIKVMQTKFKVLLNVVLDFCNIWSDNFCLGDETERSSMLIHVISSYLETITENVKLVSQIKDEISSIASVISNSSEVSKVSEAYPRDKEGLRDLKELKRKVKEQEEELLKHKKIIRKLYERIKTLESKCIVNIMDEDVCFDSRSNTTSSVQLIDFGEEKEERNQEREEKEEIYNSPFNGCMIEVHEKPEFEIMLEICPQSFRDSNKIKETMVIDGLDTDNINDIINRNKNDDNNENIEDAYTDLDT